MSTNSLAPARRAVDAAPWVRPWFDGAVLVPGDDGYDDARRGWNRTIDSRPAAIAIPATPADVAATVVAARDRGLALAAQSTGHGTVVAADGALLLRTDRLDRLEIDAAQ